MSSRSLISVIVPVYNEVDGINNFVTTSLLPVLEKINYNYELIIVNDGSTDNTLKIIQSLATKNSKIKILSLSRNFGKESALSAGLNYAKGAAAITIDSDGQQPPKLIPEFIKKWEKGGEVITGVREQFSKHGLIQKLGSKLFYWLLRIMGNKSTVPGSTDFRLLDRVVIDEFNKLSEHNRITRGLIDWLGFKQIYIEYVYGVRAAGKPSYNLRKLFKLAIDSFISMSTTPPVIFGYFGVFISIASLILGLFCIVNQYILGDPLHLYWNGSVQLAIFITFLVGLLMISQGIASAYVSRIYTESQNRPLYIIDKKESRNLKND